MSEASWALCAGPLRMTFDPESGWLRYVRLAGTEVVRAVYPAVRDRFWDTLPVRLSNLAAGRGGDHFRITFDAECRRGPVRYAFSGELTGTAAGAVTYRFDGAARTSFLANRIGLCVLHPVAGCAGAACDVERPDGHVERTAFPAEVSPHQPFHDVRALAHAVAPGVRLEVRFDGDVFETEDQRNWTDASFKTYSTPLARPVPVAVPAGATVRQAVTLRLVGDVPATPPPAQPPGPAVRWGGPSVRLPRLGLGASDEPLTVAQAEQLRPLRLDHLRLELTAADAAGRLRAAADQAAAVGTGLAVALLPGADPEADLRRIAECARAVRPPVRAWSVCRGPDGVAGAAELALARRYLADVAPAARFGAGTNLYFAQLNRARPPLGDADFVTFSANPQVHAFDDASLVETLDGQSDVIAAARALAGGRAVAVSPVTLRPRFNPNGELPPEEREPGEPPDADDPRQSQPFAAAWALGSVRRLAAAGAASATYFEATGPRGVLGDAGPYPVYHVFAALAEFAGAAVDVCRCSRPLEVEALRATGGGGPALVANLTAKPQTVALTDEAGGPVRGTVQNLGEQAARPFDGAVGLGPYAVVRVEPAG